ncbi:MAG: hypothetical protein DRH57_03435 [Candidatus Cloacimonadota bacterium]|nr:MAG: hypothetical protein DRH57_03435 [Candidatus Cloacimonadota bacterium]
MSEKFFEGLNLYEDLLKKQKEKFESLFNTCMLINGTYTVDNLFRDIARQSIKLCGAERCFIGLFQDGKIDFKLAIFDTDIEIESPDKEISHLIINNTLKTKKPQLIDDALSESQEYSDSIERLQLRSVLCVPMIYNKKILGVIYLDNRSEVKKFDITDLYYLSIFSNFAAVSVHNTLLNALLTESEKKYRNLVENVNDIIFSLDVDWNFTFVNRNGADILGYTSEEIIGKSFYNVIIADDLPELEKSFAKSLNGILQPYEVRVITKNGEIKYISIFSKPVFKDNNLIGVFGVGRDITLQKEYDEKLKRELEKRARELHIRYKTIFENANDAIFIMDGENFVECNKRAVELFGFPREELLKLKPFDISPDTQPDGILSKTKAREKIQSALNGQPQTFYWKHLTCNNKLIDTEVSLNKLSLNGKDYIQAIVRDVTEQKELTAQLLQSQKLQSVGLLTGGIAHDFNNILAAILGYTQLSLLKASKSTPIYKHLKVIEESALRAKGLTTNLLAFSRKMKIHPKPININEEIQNVYKIVRSSLNKNINIKLNLDKDVLLISGEPSRISRVIMNLCINSAEAMPNGGDIIITTERTIISEDKGFLIQGNYIKITIEDTGIGIDEKNISHIFDPFFTTKKKGTGLGLSIVYGIIRSHNGEIKVESKKGIGTKFSIYIPEYKSEGKVESKPADNRQNLYGKETILFVDDEKNLVDLTASLLKQYGYNVLCAYTGEQGLEVFAKNEDKIDLVVFDIRLGGMDGIEFINSVHQIKDNIKSIAISGFMTDKDDQGLKSAKVDSFLGKPFNLDDFLKKIREVMDQ